MGSGAVDAETDLSGNVTANYVYFGGARIAKRDASKAVHFYYSDHLGSTSLITDANGDMSPQAESDYFPYGGEIVITADSTSNHYKYTGKERDSESGLDNFGARYDSSALGRFMTPDWAAKPITVPYAKFGDPQTLNLYAYVENAPVNRADADGHTDPNSFRMGDCDQEHGDQQCTTHQNDAIAAHANQQDQSRAQQSAAQAQQQNTAQNQDNCNGQCTLMAAGRKGERGGTATPGGTDNPFKKLKPDPKDPSKVIYKDKNGKEIRKAKPGGFDEYWKKKHPDQSSDKTKTDKTKEGTNTSEGNTESTQTGGPTPQQKQMIQNTEEVGTVGAILFILYQIASALD